MSIEIAQAIRANAETKLEKAVARIVSKRGEDCLSFINDVLSGGCVNGTVNELIYYRDTLAFYKRHRKDIQKLAVDMMEECGVDDLKGIFGDKFDSPDPFCRRDSNKNLLAWFGFEEALRSLVGLDI
jgi:hypothetical protein